MRTNLLEHRYGENVTVFDSIHLNTLLTELSSKDTFQPQINRIVRRLYSSLFSLILDRENGDKDVTVDTRMATFTPKGTLRTKVLDDQARWVIVDLARAGMIPSEVCFDEANEVLDATRARIDHVFINRKVDENEQVIGTDVSGNKIGGDVEDALLLFPDPMGATGSSIADAIGIYRDQVEGTPRKVICAHLIITPEYLRRITTDFPDVAVYALRVDRGLSEEEVLATIPGERWDEEKGLSRFAFSRLGRRPFPIRQLPGCRTGPIPMDRRCRSLPYW